MTRKEKQDAVNNMKALVMTDDLPWGIKDTYTDKIVGRSTEGYKLVSRIKTLNNNAGFGNGDRFQLAMKVD